jgi:hypothetical protein
LHRYGSKSSHRHITDPDLAGFFSFNFESHGLSLEPLSELPSADVISFCAVAREKTAFNRALQLQIKLEL